MNHFSFLFSPGAQALGHTLVYSLWQAFIVFICLRLILKFIPNAAARVRYLLSYFAYAGIALWFLITLFGQLWSMQNQLMYQDLISQNALQQIQFRPSSDHNFATFSFTFLNNYLPFITGFYLLGIVWFTARLLLNYFKTSQLKIKATISLEPKWQQRVLHLAEQINIQKKVRAYFSRYIETPVMIGFLKPVILLPVATLNHLSVQQFEAILLHELAHIRRNDYLFNLLQSLIDTVLFFNPFTWWISKYIRDEREKCCDEMVLKLSDPHHYARALLALEEPMRRRALVMTAVSKRSQLFHRIKNIMEMKNNRINLRQKFIALSVIAVAIISVAWLTPKERKTVQAVNQMPVSKISYSLIGPAALSGFSVNNFFAKTVIDSPPPPVTPIPPKPPKEPKAPQPLASNVAPLPPLSPLPTEPAIAPNPPVPPLPPMPPMPPLDKIKDTGSPVTDFFNSKEWKQQQEEIKKSTAAMQKYFQSDAWKKQQKLIQKNSLAMQKYFNSPAWKKQQKEIEKSASKMQKYFNSPEWKKQQDEFEKGANMHIEQYFNSPQWKKQQEEIQKNAAHVQDYFNSEEWKRQAEQIKHSSDSVVAYFKSDAWKKQQENLQKVMAETKHYFESADWKKQQAELKKAMEESTKMWKDSQSKEK
jgi:bla regulator protein blaR1